MGSQTQTEKTTIPGAGGEEAGLRAILAQLAKRTAGGMDPLADLAAGKLSPSEQDRQFIETTQQAAAEIARRSAERNFRSQKRLVEESLIGKGMESGSREAVVKALLGQEHLDSLDTIALQQQGQTAEQMTSLPFQRAGVQLSANQALLERLVGTANPVLQAGLQERLAQTKRTTKTSGGGWQTAMALGAQAAGVYGDLIKKPATEAV